MTQNVLIVILINGELCTWFDELEFSFSFFINRKIITPVYFTLPVSLAAGERLHYGPRSSKREGDFLYREKKENFIPACQNGCTFLLIDNNSFCPILR